MNIVKVNASIEYEVKIGSGLLSALGSEIAHVTKATSAVIVSDSNVWPLYGQQAQESLKNSGFSVISFVFPAGESSKCGATYLQLMEFLALHHITRSDCLIALGGGVVGDLTGFAAATYLRGIAYIQVPTTLLAAVDSSVGGKTAIDLEHGKNLAGAFYQPRLVLCDTNTLNTLPTEIFLDGCAEVIKYGVLYDAELFAHLNSCGPMFDREKVITKCVQWKRRVVAEDEFDTGSRMKLNFGHTIGHGVEAASQYEISHGKAVAIGMAIVSRASAARSICTSDTAGKIESLLSQFSLPVRTEYDSATLFEAALSDKKRNGNTVNLILPKAIGDCVIAPTPVDQLKSFIQEGL